MWCARCGVELSDDYEFCWRCSEPVLCIACWNEHGCCEADEGSGLCVDAA